MKKNWALKGLYAITDSDLAPDNHIVEQVELALLGGARIVYQTVEGLLAGQVGADLALTLATIAAILLWFEPPRHRLILAIWAAWSA